MSITITKNNNYINFNLQSNNKYLLTTSYANSLRRILLTSIKSFGFKYIPYKHTDNYIIIDENTSINYHNDKLSKRISLLTLNTSGIKMLILLYLAQTNNLDEMNLQNLKTNLKINNVKKYLEHIKFKVNVINKTNTNKFITTDMIDIYIDDKILNEYDTNILTDIHYQFLDSFNKEYLIEHLKSGDISTFTEQMKQLIFNHIKVDSLEINDKLYPPKYYPKLLTELNSNEKLMLSMTLTTGIGSSNTTYDVVSTISYNFEKDYELIKMNLKDITKNVDGKLEELGYESSRWDNPENFVITNELIYNRNEIPNLELRELVKEKDLLIQRYNIHDSYRVYKTNDNNIPAQFNFEYKYEGVVENKRLLYKGFKELNKQINSFKNLFSNINHIPYKDNHITIIYSEVLEDAVDIYIEKSTHTVMNLINDYLYYLIVNNNNTFYTAYMRTHKLSDKYLLRVITNNYKEDIISVCNYLNALTNELMTNL